MKLFELLNGEMPGVMPEALARNEEILGLTCDSRQVEPGFLFAALPGAQADGRSFIGDAVERGAAVVLASPGTSSPASATGAASAPFSLIIDKNPRRRFALMAARFFSRQPATVGAVTGTNGKTSTISFLRQIWARLGRHAASLGTLGLSAPGMEAAGGLTTPDPVDLHRKLRDLADRGVDCLAMEASSHGLAQHRLDGVDVTVAAFTNITRDHLDYHGSMADYMEAKMRLLGEVMKPGGTAVLNADAECFEALRRMAEVRRQLVIGFGANGGEVRLQRCRPRPGGQRLDLVVLGDSYQLDLPLIGSFQAENALCALAMALATGESASQAVSALECLQGVPGRLQKVADTSAGASVFVDYAHTPDALSCLLKALRLHAEGRLHLVFGCGGERDSGKRPDMGRLAGRLADVVFITDDNPRGENAAAIRAQILAACPGAREIGDRREAITASIAGLQPGDLLVIAGKGHEQGQIVGHEVRPFDDAQVVRVAIGGPV